MSFLPKDVEFEKKGLIPHVDPWRRTEKTPVSLTHVVDKKIIFLGDENLELLKGYKVEAALVDCSLVYSPHGTDEIQITITGLSWKFAQQLFEKLKAMNPKEVCGK